MADVLNGRLLRFLFAGGLIYVASVWLLDAPDLLLVLNGLVMSASAGICVAYAPVFIAALLRGRPSKGDYLGAGIFMSWSTTCLLRVVSVVGRDFGWPGIHNTNWQTSIIWLNLMSGLLHLWAPYLVEERSPRAKWVSTGIITAVGFFIVFALWTTNFHPRSHPLVELR